MRLEPVKRTERPGYPTRDELLAREGFLEKCLPRGWKVGRDLAGAAAFLLAVNLTGCDGSTPPPARPPATVSTTEDGAGRLGVTSEAAAVVAPIFDHGEGRGATGCIVVSPPVFLSEEEALQVLTEELAQHGIELKTSAAIERLTVTPRLEGWEDEPVPLEELEPVPLDMDGVDPLNQVAVTYISERDCERLDRKTYISSVSVYDAKGLARHVAEQIKEQGRQKLYAGIFYDPIVCMDFNYSEDLTEKTQAGPEDRRSRWERREEKAASESKELLRRQAKDFVAWLQRQGVL